MNSITQNVGNHEGSTINSPDLLLHKIEEISFGSFYFFVDLAVKLPIILIVVPLFLKGITVIHMRSAACPYINKRYTDVFHHIILPRLATTSAVSLCSAISVIRRNARRIRIAARGIDRIYAPHIPIFC